MPEPVWQDAKIKSRPIFTKVAQKVAKAVFNIQRDGFKISKKVAQYLG